jgi:lipoprotein signal peptidase
LTKRRWPVLPKFEIRFGWLALVAVAAQLIVIYVGFGEAEELRRFVFPASYVLLLAFIILNRRRVGFLVIGAGTLLNFLAIVTNGGLMPISPASMEKGGLGDELAERELGDAVPLTKNVLLEESETNLQWLTDRLTWDSLGPFPVFSVGDVIIAAGLVVVLVEIFLPLIGRGTSRDRPSLT